MIFEDGVLDTFTLQSKIFQIEALLEAAYDSLSGDNTSRTYDLLNATEDIAENISAQLEAIHPHECDYI